MADVFISYSRKDATKAEVVVKALRDRGWSVFWDRDLDAGRYDEALEKELADAKCVIVLVSASSRNSRHVLDEGDRAIERNVLVPALIEPVRMPIGWGRIQHVDLSNWTQPSSEPDWRSLFVIVGKRAPKPMAPKPEPVSVAAFPKLDLSKYLNRPWYELPRLFAVPRMRELRGLLQTQNLYDTEEPLLQPSSETMGGEGRFERTRDGTFNDIKYPAMGSSGRRFGRNVPLEQTIPDNDNLLTPSPRLVSLELMTRDGFQPATFLNLLAAAWLHFIAHGRFLHARTDPSVFVEVPLPPGDTWPGGSMRIARTLRDPTPSGSTRPPAYANHTSHWWDASQLYGAGFNGQSELTEAAGRRFSIDRDTAIPFAFARASEVAGFRDNYWIGLTALQAIFLLEHNYISDALASAYPKKSDRWLFSRCAMILSALLAKIHILEWLTSMAPNSSVRIAVKANWRGLEMEDLEEMSEITEPDSEFAAGIIGSARDHWSVPFALTEELASVYRMHPLMPDSLTFRSAATGAALVQMELPDVCGSSASDIAARLSLPDLLYTLGTSYPGALTLHNYPKHLQNLRAGPSIMMDLAAVDIFRDRERGVPRYNQFRRLVHKDPVTSFDRLTDNRIWRKELKKVYGDVSKVDLMTGLYAEPVPAGFGFSETAFRIMFLMHARWLKSDRFFTDDFRPEVYTEFGIEYIENTRLFDVLVRHAPSVAGVIENTDNAFQPWRSITQ